MPFPGGLQPGPIIKVLSPDEGWIHGGQTVTVIGENFFPGISVVFGNTPVTADYLTSNALKVITPTRQSSGAVDVSLAFKNQTLTKPGFSKFVYGKN